MKIKLFAFALLFSFSTDLIAKPALVVFEYRDKNTAAEETEKFTDRLREEFRRRLSGSVLDRQETADLFGYHKQAALRMKSSEAAKLFEEGKKAYFELHLVEALAFFEKIIRLPRGESVDVLIEARLLQGLSWMAQGDLIKARQSFEESLRLDPKVTLDPSFFPPKAVKFFQQTAREIDLHSGILEVEAFPTGAEVRVNGVLKGLAPMRLTLPGGRHLVSVAASHYHGQVQTANIREGSDTSLKIRLPWEKGGSGKFLGISDVEIGSAERLSVLGARIGELLGTDKVLFVSYHTKAGVKRVTTHLIDVSLKTAHKEGVFPAANIQETSAEVADQVADHLIAQMGESLGQKPEKFAQNRFEGDIVLIGHHRKPFYKQPLFWVVVGAAGAGGGIAAALTGGGAATGTLGVIFQ